MWLQTFTGRQFFPLAPSADQLDILDIAHALSNQCRFAGHSQSFYSIAQHSVLVSKVCDPRDALWGLLHDAAEAYLVDIPKPLKRQLEFASYRELEKKALACICAKFGLPLEEPQSVKDADLQLLATEKLDLMGPSPADWGPLPLPCEFTITPWGPEQAERAFLERFEDLSGRP